MWFTEDAWTPMAVLGVAAIVCLGLWNSSQKSSYLFVALALVASVGLTWLIEGAVVTEREKLELLVHSLCDDFRRKEPRTLDYFSKQAGELRATAQHAMDFVQIQDDLRLTDFETEVTNDNSRGRTHFRANATVSLQTFGSVGRQPFRAILDWQREEGEWKIVGLRRLNPLNGEEMQVMSQSAK